MSTDDLRTGSAPMRRRESDRTADRTPDGDTDRTTGGTADRGTDRTDRTGGTADRGTDRDESTRMTPDEARDLDEVRPDAVSPQERRDTEAPVRGGMTADDGQGAAGGRDHGGPGGRELRTQDDVAGRGVHSERDD